MPRPACYLIIMLPGTARIYTATAVYFTVWSSVMRDTGTGTWYGT